VHEAPTLPPPAGGETPPSEAFPPPPREVDIVSEELRAIAAAKPSGVRVKGDARFSRHAATVDEVVADRRRDPRCEEDE
jgi:hypothetical protein